MTFTFSFLGPLVIGVYCYIKYRDVKQRKLLVFSSVVIGIIVAIINLTILFLFFHEFGGYEFLILFIIIMIDFLFTPLLVFGSIQVLIQRNESKNLKRNAIILSLVLALIVCITIIGSGFIPIRRIYPQYSYCVSVSTNATNSYLILVPIPLVGSSEISHLVNPFERIPGNVNVSIVSTPYGLALNLSATGSFTLDSKTKIGLEFSFDNVTLQNATEWMYYLIYYNTTTADDVYVDISGWGSRMTGGIRFFVRGMIVKMGWNNVWGSFSQYCA